MEKYKTKYRIKSAHHPNWDYGSNGLYFISICTKKRKHFFCKIVQMQNIAFPYKMELNEIRKIAKIEWLKTFEIRTDMNSWVGEYVVMPNHFHAIIGIGDKVYNSQRRDAKYWVSTDTKNKFGPPSINLASIVRGFKIGVAKNVRHINPDFSWQSPDHDHIIRNDKSFHMISHYIENNPLNWKKDIFYE